MQGFVGCRAAKSESCVDAREEMMPEKVIPENLCRAVPPALVPEM